MRISNWMCKGMVALCGLVAASGAARGAEKKPKYYFNIVEVNVDKASQPGLAEAARDLLKKDLEGRPEFTSDLGEATDPAAVVAALRKKNLQGFGISLRVDRVTKETKPPRPGGRLNQLAIDLKVSVFGVTIPGEKIAFSGDGETAIEAEVSERRMDEETAILVKDVLAQSLKQAVDQAVQKLSLPKSVPMNESKKKRRKE